MTYRQALHDTLRNEMLRDKDVLLLGIGPIKDVPDSEEHLKAADA